MKIALVLSSNLWYAPFLKYYSSVLDKHGIEYEVISWNRDGKDNPYQLQYNKQISYTEKSLKKIVLTFGYISFVRNRLKKNRYDKVIVFGQLVGFFLSGFLKRKYKHKFIFDYRDVSYDQHFMFKHLFRRASENASFVTISSPAYRQFFRGDTVLYLSHNINEGLIASSLSQRGKNTKPITPYKISVIGGIRTYEENRQLIEQLGNDPRFQICFSGGGVSVDALKEYASSKKITNITFTGFYKKEEEELIYCNTDIVYIFLPKKVNFSTAMSNRLYNSLLFKKPYIVNSTDIQGYYSSKYDVGLRINDTNGLGDKIQDYIESLDMNKFVENCNQWLSDIQQEINVFNAAVLNFSIK